MHNLRQPTHSLKRIMNVPGREMSIKLMCFWCSHVNNTSPFYVCGRKIVEGLDEQQCKNLNHLEPFVLDGRFKHLIDCFRADFSHRLPKAVNVGQEDQLALNKAELASLRMVAVTYLNFLETVATAWRHNVGDRGIIEEEFQKILSKENEFVLEKFRKVNPAKIEAEYKAFCHICSTDLLKYSINLVIFSPRISNQRIPSRQYQTFLSFR